MSNQYFQFKEFRVEQDKCAMKISTDACIQGAWTPIYDNVKHVLDIGTGTGLLSLMLAQRNEQVHIDAIELDKQAAEQAKENTAISPFGERINVIQRDAKDYQTIQQYDLIICNPPFFQNSLLGNNHKRNTARHTLSLSYDDILNICETNLSENGYASVLMPYSEYAYWKKLVQSKEWTLAEILLIQPRKDVAINRVVSIINKNKSSVTEEHTLIIYEPPGIYTQAFKELLAPFYLFL